MTRTILVFVFLFSCVSMVLSQITVDGSAAEWTGTAPATDNTFVYRSGTAGGLNEWIWKDASGDNRTDNFGSFVDGTKQDLLEVRIASNSSNLFYLAKFPSNIDKTPGDGSLQLQITIRRQSSTATAEFLGGFPDTKVPSDVTPGGSVADARWDFLIMTRGGSSNTNNIVWTTNFGSSSNVGSFAINAPNGIFEGSVPWSSLGGAPNSETMIFTFSLYRANTSDNTFDTGGDNSKGNCLDYVTTTSGNTFGALIGESGGGVNDQGRMDYSVSLQFSGDQSLPVSLSSFTATAGNNQVVLKWVTESEVQNVGFEILRSQGSEDNYELISSYQNNPALEGQFTTNNRTQYAFTDNLVVNGRTYWYKLVDVDANGIRTEHGPVAATPLANGAEITTRGLTLPQEYVLAPNFPNPFNPATRIQFGVPQTIAGSENVILDVFNIQGLKVKELINANLAPGMYEVQWDGTNDRGAQVASGIYFYQLRTDSWLQTRKMTLIR